MVPPAARIFVGEAVRWDRLGGDIYARRRYVVDSHITPHYQPIDTRTFILPYLAWASDALLLTLMTD